MATTCRLIILASSAIAEIYRYNLSSRAKLELVQELTHPESTLKDQNIVADEPGGYHHNRTFVPRTDPKALESEHFATILAHALDQHATNAQEIYVIAPADFCAMVKTKLKKPTSEKITKYIDKNYVKLGIKDLEKHLSKLLNLTF